MLAAVSTIRSDASVTCSGSCGESLVWHVTHGIHVHDIKKHICYDGDGAGTRGEATEVGVGGTGGRVIHIISVVFFVRPTYMLFVQFRLDLCCGASGLPCGAPSSVNI